MKKAIVDGNNTAHYILFGISIAIMIIFGGLIFGKTGSNFGHNFKSTMTVAIFAVAIRFFHIVCVYMFSRKETNAFKFSNIMRVFLLNFVYDSILFIILWLTLALHLYRLMAIALIVIFVVDILSNYVATTAVINDVNRSVRITLIINIMIAAITVFVIQQVVISGINSMAGSIFNMFGSIDGLMGTFY